MCNDYDRNEHNDLSDHHDRDFNPDGDEYSNHNYGRHSDHHDHRVPNYHD